MKEWWQNYKEYLLAQSDINIGNPLGDETLLSLLNIIIEALILLATPIVVLSVIYAGFLFVTAQGNTEKLDKAKRAITYALLGALILLGAEAISQLIQGTIESLK
ncbi:MAG: hypothetical protein U5L75_00280 [Candidatus Campbellbacteria bacterium]|nr:hypothetical protein [Candidatus Campbellbacteria bacterium]